MKLERYFSYALRLVTTYPLEFLVAGAVTSVVGLASLGLLLGPFLCSFYIMAFKAIRRIKPDLLDIFKGFELFWESFVVGLAFLGGPIFCGFLILLISLLVQSKVGVMGTVAFFLGAFICGLSLLLTGPLFMYAFGFIVDKKMGIRQALHASAHLARKDFAFHLVFFMASWIIAFIGLLGFGFGMFLTVPLALLAQCFLYLENVVKRQEGGEETSRPRIAAVEGEGDTHF